MRKKTWKVDYGKNDWWVEKSVFACKHWKIGSFFVIWQLLLIPVEFFFSVILDFPYFYR